MPNLSQTELNAIREVVSCHQTMSSKLGTYASQCNDPQIKQMFTQASQQAKKSAQDLISMI